jgi:glycosyltransferase involved in cell wall biosynthesis
VRSVGVRDLLRGPPRPDRVLLYSIWFRDHNNPRYAELLPRLDRLDACLLRVPSRRTARRIAYYSFQAVRRPSHKVLFAAAARRYHSLLALDFDQLASWHGSAVMDADDPFFAGREVELLNRPALRAYVVTAESAGRRYESLGVEKPWVVIPQGVSLGAVTPELRAAARARRRPDEVVVGWMAAHLLLDGDRGGDNALYNVEHLLGLWDEIHDRVPAARLWLVGGASEALSRRVRGRDDVLLLGRLPREQALAAAAAFDLALYARTEDQGVRAAKVAELMGLGVPSVSYDYDVTADLRETGAGVLVPNARSFVAEAARLLDDAAARAAVARAALEAGSRLDWDALARRFEREVLDVYLPGAIPRP